MIVAGKVAALRPARVGGVEMTLESGPGGDSVTVWVPHGVGIVAGEEVAFEDAVTQQFDGEDVSFAASRAVPLRRWARDAAVRLEV